MFANRRRRAFVPSVSGLEYRALTTTFEPIAPPANLIGHPTIGLPGPLPVPPMPAELNGPLQPYNNVTLPAPDYIAV
jgi:hypothetical protein